MVNMILKILSYDIKHEANLSLACFLCLRASWFLMVSRCSAQPALLSGTVVLLPPGCLPVGKQACRTGAPLQRGRQPLLSLQVCLLPALLPSLARKPSAHAPLLTAPSLPSVAHLQL